MDDTQPNLLTDDTDTFRKIWDTSFVPVAQRFSYFSQAMHQALPRFFPKDSGQAYIDARIVLAALPNGYISSVQATPHKLETKDVDATDLLKEYMSLQLVFEGHSHCVVGGQVAERKPGSLNLFEEGQIQSIEFTARSKFIVLHFEKSLLKRSASFAKLEINGAVGGLLCSCISVIDMRLLSGSKKQLARLFDATLSLLIVGLDQDSVSLEHLAATDNHKGILRGVKDFVASELADPDLTTASIAQKFGVSSRQIQNVFAHEGETLKSYVQSLRLDRIYLDLRNPSLDHLSPIVIACRWGFRDPSTFYRNFRNRFKETPLKARISARDSLQD